jgi:hypothetical protein
MSTLAERREWPRHAVLIAARAQFPGGPEADPSEVRAVLVADVSAGGMQILADAPVPPEGRLQVLVAEGRERMLLTALVAWRRMDPRSPPGRYVCGVIYRPPGQPDTDRVLALARVRGAG